MILSYVHEFFYHSHEQRTMKMKIKGDNKKVLMLIYLVYYFLHLISCHIPKIRQNEDQNGKNFIQIEVFYKEI